MIYIALILYNEVALKRLLYETVLKDKRNNEGLVRNYSKAFLEKCTN